MTCKIIEYKFPCFIWNIDEKKILQYPDTYRIFEKDGFKLSEIKPGNMMKFVNTYSEISPELIAEINTKHGIVFLPNHETVSINKDQIYYRFIEVE